MKQLTLTLSGNTCDFTTRFREPIVLSNDEDYEAAFISLETYNSIPNINEKNNKFDYSADGGVSWKTITLDKGAYNLVDINNEIQRQMILNNDYDVENNSFYINLSHFTLFAVVQIMNPDYKVNFDVDNSIGTLLGFDKNLLTYGYNKSPKIVDITNVNSILVNVDLIHGSYVGEVRGHSIHSFIPDVEPGYQLRERPQPELIFYPLNSHYINTVRVWLTNQDQIPIDLQGERITVRIAIRKTK